MTFRWLRTGSCALGDGLPILFIYLFGFAPEKSVFAKAERCGAPSGAAACFHWKLNQRTVDIKFSLPKNGIAKKKKKKKRVTQQSMLKLEIWTCVGGACMFFTLSHGLYSSCCWFRLEKKKDLGLCGLAGYTYICVCVKFACVCVYIYKQ